MNRPPRPENLRTAFIFVLLTASLLEAQGPAPISAALREKVDTIARQALTGTGVPSASIAIVQGGAITYLQAYGDGRIEPHAPALPAMRYSIGSITSSLRRPRCCYWRNRGSFRWTIPCRDSCPT
ncbi:MAG TPA: hypothetical protein VF311_11730 [Terriglobales bacterium]